MPDYNETIDSYTTEVGGLSLDDITSQIAAIWKVGSDSRLQTGKLLSTVLKHKMLDRIDISFSDYVEDFGIKRGMGYLLVRVWDDGEVRELVRGGIPWTAADAIIGIGNKHGIAYRNELIAETRLSKNAARLCCKAKEIRKVAYEAANPPPPPPEGPEQELAAAQAVVRELLQERDGLMAKVKEIDAKISKAQAEARRLECSID